MIRLDDTDIKNQCTAAAKARIFCRMAGSLLRQNGCLKIFMDSDDGAERIRIVFKQALNYRCTVPERGQTYA